MALNGSPPPPMTVPVPRRTKTPPQLANGHQASHRNLFEDGNMPRSRDLESLFCILMVALPLKARRVRLQRRPCTFTTLDAIDKLSNLTFLHTNRRPSPEDPSRMLCTTLTTTYSMIPDMGRVLCSYFLGAGFIQPCERRADFHTSDSVWQVTPKGLCLVQFFVARNGVAEPHISAALDSPLNNLQLTILERERGTDTILDDRGTIELLFKRFVGAETPTMLQPGAEVPRDNTTASARLLAQRRIHNRPHIVTFTGRRCLEWLMASCTFISVDEAIKIAAKFVASSLCELLVDEQTPPGHNGFNPSEHASYKVTKRGMEAASWVARTHDDNGSESPKSNATSRDSNRSRLILILSAPVLRILFREFLRDTHCEENFVFTFECDDFLLNWQANSRGLDEDIPVATLRGTLSASHDLYNAFLAPGSPCELNIDHNLRFALVRRMTHPELAESELRSAVEETVSLFSECKDSIFKLMASDSVPKFVKEPRYAEYLEMYGIGDGNMSSSNGSTKSNVTVEMTKFAL